MNKPIITAKAEVAKINLSTLKMLSDEELVNRYRMGDDAAFCVIASRYQAKTMRTLYFETRDYDVACDIWQEVLIKISDYLRSDKYKEFGKLSGLISLSAHNKFKDYYRAKVVKKEDLMEVGSPIFGMIETGMEEVIEREGKLDFIYEKVQELPEDQKIVFEMIQGGYKFREVADKLGISINTAISRYQYAIKKIRSMAEAYAVSAN